MRRPLFAVACVPAGSTLAIRRTDAGIGQRFSTMMTMMTFRSGPSWVGRLRQLEFPEAEKVAVRGAPLRWRRSVAATERC